MSEDGADRAAKGGLRDRVAGALRSELLIGRIQPGKSMTLRGLADQLGVSPMPVREAIRELVAGGAIAMSGSGRITVAQPDQRQLAEILDARALLEPHAARLALPYIDRATLRKLAEIDQEIDARLLDGDVEAYMRLNHAFHFTIYRQSRSDVFVPLIESVWLRFGPFMRMVYGRVGTSGLVDHHKAAIAAAAAGDADGFAAAIALDIREGMGLIGEALQAVAPPSARRPGRKAAVGI